MFIDEIYLNKLNLLGMKRIFDFCLSFLLLLLLFPLLIVLCLLIWISTKSNPVFKQERVGSYGEFFIILKLKTMYDETNGLHLTVGEDDRITPIGKWLRKTKLDELPQLWNIFIGEMTFVGPRPELPFYVKYYTEEQREVFDLKPGVTSNASIKYVNEGEILGKQNDPEKYYIDVILQDKLAIEQSYLKNNNLWIDITIMIKTLKRILF